jgi:hypothetical protein
MSDTVLVISNNSVVASATLPSNTNPENSTIVTPIAAEAISALKSDKNNITGKGSFPIDTNSDVGKQILNEEKVSLDLKNPTEQQTSSNSDKEAKSYQGEIEELVDEQEDDNASVLVIILQCETKSCDANITNLKWVFSDPYFTVQVCAVDPPPNIPIIKTLTRSQYMENYCMRKALNYAAEGPYISNAREILEPQFWWSKIPVIIVKDSSVNNITPSGIPNNPEDEIIGGMKHRIKVALDRARQADLFFLCKWNDACNKYTDVEGVGNIDHGSTLKWSVQPTAIQAIMYTPSSRDYIRESLITTTVTLSDLLNTNIIQGNLLATVFVPNIIDFDIDLATSNDDYNKLNECAPVQANNQSTSGITSFLWLTVIVIIIILVAWALIQLGPQYVSAPLS